jgi:hypothetical protein
MESFARGARHWSAATEWGRREGVGPGADPFDGCVVTHGCISPPSVHAVEAFASRVRQWGRRGRRRVVDGDLPQSWEEANAFVRANPDGLQLLWSVIRSASRGLDEFDAALADARRAENTVGAWLAEAERQPTATDVDDYAVVQARRQLLAEITAYRSARIALAGAIEAASEPFSALVTHVGCAVEVALLFDREVKRRRFRDAQEEGRKHLEAIRLSADEHLDLQAKWESRLRRRFRLPRIGE